MEIEKIPSEQFFERYSKIAQVWTSQYNFDALAILYGKEDQRATTIKTSALHIYLLGYEFIDSLLFLTKKSIILIASQKKFQYIEHFKHKLQGQLNIHLITKGNNNQEEIKQAFKIIQEETNSDKLKIGQLIKEKQYGQLAQDYESSINSQIEIIEMGPLVQEVLCKKDQIEIENIKKSAKLSCYLQNKLIEHIENIIDEELNEKHIQISQKIENLIQKEDHKQILQKKFNLDCSLIDLSYSPIIQSGGVYDVRPQAESDNRELKYDVIMCSIGSKYHEYNTTVVRTLFINPSEKQKKAYLSLLDLHNYVIQQLTPGKKLKDIYTKTQSYLKQKYPDFVDNINNYFGHGIGLEFRESNLLINDKNEKEIKQNMVFNICLNFTGLHNEGNDYAINICDTVLIKEQGCENLTVSIQKKYEDVCYQLDLNQPQQQQQQREQKTKEPKQTDQQGRRTRGQQLSNQDNDQRRKQHQKQLLQRKQEELDERLASGGFKTGQKRDVQIQLEKIQAYKNQNEIPKDVFKNQIYVDIKNDVIILPINGQMIPFHVSVIKNVSKHDEGNTSSIRFNFHVPGSNLANANIIFPSLNKAPIYIKELTFRSQDIKKLNENLKKIKDMQKNQKLKEQEMKNRDELAIVDAIQLIKGKRPTMQDLNMRPNLTGRKTTGTLEAHQNGFRYQSNKNEKIDLNYKNIKHAFFQSCDGEMTIIIHFNLFEPIMLGKKKTYDIQFYVEAGVQAEDLDFKKRGFNDQDEYEEEEREKALRKRLNQEFGLFCKAVEGIAQDQLKFETPYRDLGFYGTPHRSQVFICPTINCLINLIEQPFFVFDLNQLEVAHFERIQFGLKNFDLALVNKNYDIPVVRISAIPISHLEPIRNWLDKMDILFSETNKNLAWDVVMNQIKSDIKQFVEDGGWAFLQEEDESEASQQSDEEESEFEVSESEQDDESSYEESDQDLEDEEEEESDYNEDDDLSEEGMSWDELEEIAKKSNILQIKEDLRKDENVAQKTRR